MVTVWKIAPGDRARVWDDCYERRCISINWLTQTDYSVFRTKREIKRALIKAREGEGGGGANSIWQFVKVVQQGDVVVANDGILRIVGIGLVRSGYLAPHDPRNPNRKQDEHNHVRLVDWLVHDPVDIQTRLFGQHTVHELNPAQYRPIIRAYLKQYPRLENTLDALFGQRSAINHLGPAADEAESDDDPAYFARKGDHREQAWQLIKKRRGQPQFRDALLRRFEKRCVVTGCETVDVLEAAHIDPYRDEGHHHPGNGLLLRADIHTLFDLDLLGIEPDSLCVVLHPDIAKEYKALVGKTLNGLGKRSPLPEPLKRRYKLFQKRKEWPA